MYIYMYIHMCIYICIYIYIYLFIDYRPLAVDASLTPSPAARSGASASRSRPPTSEREEQVTILVWGLFLGDIKPCEDDIGVLGGGLPKYLDAQET